MKLLLYSSMICCFGLLHSCDNQTSIDFNSSAKSNFLTEVDHPLDALNEAEISSVVELLKKEGKYQETGTLVSDIVLIEPDKSDVYNWKYGDPLNRKAEVLFRQGSQSYEGIVDVTNGQIESWVEVSDIQPSIIMDDFMKADEVWKTDKRITDALADRGYSIENVMGVPLTAGFFGEKDSRDNRLLKVWLLDTENVSTNLYAKPINGITPVVDVNTGTVVDVYLTGDDARNDATADYDEASVDVKKSKPVSIVSPQGNNYSFEDGLIQWGDWKFHLRLDKRLGPIISLATFKGQSVAYQLSLSEMFVPYMDPALDWSYRSYMDVGEYGFGFLSTPLTPGADIPGNATTFSTPIAMDDGMPVMLPDVLGLFERNTGRPIWRHAEFLNESNESRPEIELVLRSVPVVGNYDYIIDFVFSAKGTLTVEVGATGIDAAKAVKAKKMSDPTAMYETKVGNLVAPNLVGVFHDHFLSFRIDMDVDGMNNSMVTDEILPVKYKDNHRISGWEVSEHPNLIEGAISNETNGHDGFYRVVNKNSKNSLGQHKGYQIMGHTHLSQLDDEDFPQKRAAWSKEELWVTPYNRDEKYISGKYPNQSDGTDGIMKWTAQNRSIDNTDIVCWYTLGFHHITLPEDWPILSTKWTSFMLRPAMSFDENPALNASR